MNNPIKPFDPRAREPEQPTYKLVIGPEIDGHELPPFGIVRAGQEITTNAITPDGKRFLTPDQWEELKRSNLEPVDEN